MTRETWGLAAFVVAVFFAVTGVSAGLNNQHQTAIPSLLVAFAALATGIALIRK